MKKSLEILIEYDKAKRSDYLRKAKDDDLWDGWANDYSSSYQL